MKRLLGCLLLLAMAALPTLAAKPKVTAVPGKDYPAPQPAAVERWKDMRFGMFIHWGPVSLTAREIGWSRGAQTPIEKYDSLYKEFNPVKFNADEWVSVAKAAGIKYIVLTTKHHDGFCLFDTKLTDYNIMNSPFHRDVVKELSEACKKQGIAFGTYYSVCDWHHPDFPLTSPGGKVKREKSDLDAYNKYLLGQIKELVTNYGPLVYIWNDVPQMFEGRGRNTIKMIRELQPDILVNNRTGDGGDFDTPEQRVGAFQNTRPWESCMTISGHNHWAWGGEEDGVKPLATCIRMLVSCACGDGNMLFNVGPKPTGEIAQCQVDLLKQMGAWMQKNGEAIYGTRGGPFLMGKNGGSTHKGNTVWLHVYDWPEGGVTLPDPGRNIVSATVGGAALKLERTETGVVVDVPAAQRDAVDTIVRLELNVPAAGIKPVAVWRDKSLSTGKPATASNVFQKQVRSYGPALAVDGDEATRWATDAKVKQATLEVDLGKPEAIGSFRVVQTDYPRINACQVEAEREGKWTPVASIPGRRAKKGAKASRELLLKLRQPVTAQKVRLNIQGVTEGGPTVQEFQVLAPEKNVQSK